MAASSSSECVIVGVERACVRAGRAMVGDRPMSSRRVSEAAGRAGSHNGW